MGIGKSRRRGSVIAQAKTAEDISQVLIEFAAPFCGGRHDESLSDLDLERAVQLAILAWNAATPHIPAGTLEWTYEQAEVLVGAERWADVRAQLDTLMDARRTRYGDDPRIVVSYTLDRVPGRGRRLQVMTAELKKPLPS